MIDKRTSAFPIYDHHGNGQEFLADTGMTLRDYFAAKAMQTFLATVNEFPDEYWRYDIALESYSIADAMLEAKGKTQAMIEEK